MNGELVGDSEYKKRYKLIQNVEKAEFWGEEHWNHMSEIAKETDNNSRLKNEYTFEWYPLAVGYSYLFNYPENIKEDWLGGINETKDLLLKDGIDIQRCK